MSEFDKAKAWRKARGFSVAELSELSGYSIDAIYSFESGRRPLDLKANPWVWQRYKNCCAGLDAQIRAGVSFNWGD